MLGFLIKYNFLEKEIQTKVDSSTEMNTPWLSQPFIGKVSQTRKYYFPVIVSPNGSLS